MHRGRCVALMSALVLAATSTLTYAQDSVLATGPDAFGFVRRTGDAYQHYHWASSRWYESWWAMGEFQQIFFVDTLGAVSRPAVSNPRLDAEISPWVQYRVSEPYADEGPWPLLPLGYFASSDTGHAPYLEVDSPLSAAEWADLLAADTPPDSPSDPLTVRVWRATVDSTVSWVFQGVRGLSPPNCASHRQFFGLLLPGVPGVSMITSETKSCFDEHPRRPYALVRRGGRLFMLVGVLGAESPEAELWELSSHAAERLEFAPHGRGNPNVGASAKWPAL